MKQHLRICVSLFVTLALLTSLVGVDAHAQNGPNPNEENPSDYFFVEFFIGSAAGLLTAYAVERLALLYFCVGIDLDDCEGWAEAFILGPYTPVASQFAGAAAGVFASGALNGINGNVPALFIGSLSGSLAGIVVQKPIYDLMQWSFQSERLAELNANPNTPEFIKRIYPPLIEFFENNKEEIRELTRTIIPPIVAAFFGALGFNIAATVQSED